MRALVPLFYLYRWLPHWARCVPSDSKSMSRRPNKSVQVTAAAPFHFLASVFFIQSSCRLHPSTAAVPDLWR